MNLITDDQLEALETTCGQLKESLSHHDRGLAIAYAKQHISLVYTLICQLQNGPRNVGQLTEDLKDHLETLDDTKQE